MNMFEQMPFSEKYPVFRKLAEIGDLRKLSREELELYDEDIKNMRDIYATRKFDEKRLPGGSRTYREPLFFFIIIPTFFPKTLEVTDSYDMTEPFRFNQRVLFIISLN